MAGPLAGIRVIELTTMITGPLTGMMLADLGADVVKIENPNGGDPFRSFRGGLYSPHFCGYNRNKRSIILDLRADFGRCAFERLVAGGDVLLENFRPGVLDRLGFSDERLLALNRKLIRCHISGFGANGPYADRPAYDAVSQALSGMSSLFLEQDDPRIAGPTIADNVTGQYACYGILAALFERERTGAARRIDVNMLESSIAFMPDPFGYYTQMGLVSDPSLRPRTSQSYAFRCSDGKLLTVHLSSQTKFWEQFIGAIGRPDMLTDPQISSRALRIENYDVVHRIAAAEIIKRPRDHWLKEFTERDVPCAPVYDVTEVLDDPHVKHLGTFVTLEHRDVGKVVSIRRPVLFDESRDDQPAHAPPTLGEHTDEILREIGLAEDPARPCPAISS
jgi:crotonobetainyl-CoA:carnitine CoA-transferase CaiB-like acyl-CoA transferase